MTIPLIECIRGDRVKIARIDAGRGATLNLMNLGLDVGHTVELLQRSPLRGPVLVLHGETEVAIGYQLAARILVVKD